MTTKYVGQRVTRNEDPRLLTGQALFVDDVDLPGMLHAAFYVAIMRTLVSRALTQRPLVIALGCGRLYREDMGAFWKPGPLLVPAPHSIKDVIFNQRTQIPMARAGDKVRHVGEPMAVVIAESRYIAEDALADIVVDLEPLDAVVDLEKALEPGAPLIHDELGTNLASYVRQEKGNYEQARAQADVVIQRRIVIDRGVAAALENRGYVVQWNAKEQELTMWATTQAPIALRNLMSATLGISENQMRVIAPFVGAALAPRSWRASRKRCCSPGRR